MSAGLFIFLEFRVKMKTLAIIPAGGSGTRMGGDIPKQYLTLGGVPILVHTLMAFQRSSLVDDIYLVLPDEDVQKAPQKILSPYHLTKVNRVLTGGERRQDSVKRGVDLLGSDYDLVVIHDGVRPFISPAIINAAIKEAARSQAVTVGLPVTDTIKKVDSHGCVSATVNRDHLWLTQTPQVFLASLLKKAYESAYADNYYGTDDAALVERIGGKVIMIMGSYDNIKITTADDLEWGELILKTRQNRNSISSQEAQSGDMSRRVK
jgi:2-C-methyl-D-erythritol 4-phosphate cytidylyltransferase